MGCATSWALSTQPNLSRSPETSSVRSTNERGEFDATPTGTLSASSSSTAPGIGSTPRSASSMTIACSSSISARPSPGRPSWRSMIASEAAPDVPMSSRLCSIVNVNP